MLVISRNPEKSVILRHNDVEIKIKYLGRTGNQIKLGFDAPKSVDIVREEIDEPADDSLEFIQKAAKNVNKTRIVWKR